MTQYKRVKNVDKEDTTVNIAGKDYFIEIPVMWTSEDSHRNISYGQLGVSLKYQINADKAWKDYINHLDDPWYFCTPEAVYGMSQEDYEKMIMSFK